MNLIFDVCENGTQALKFVEDKLMHICCDEYELILLDYHFDNSPFNGAQVAEMIKRAIISKKRSITTKIICLSGSDENIEKVKRMHNNPFWKAFVKPLKLPQFREIVEQAFQ